MRVQKDDYYPFGMTIPESDEVAGYENKNLYNSKELVDDHNLNWYHYGARYYDPQLGRWLQVDPADEFNSPYVYCHNDPVNFIDFEGFWQDPINNGALRGWYGDKWNPEASKFGKVRSNGTTYHQGVDIYAKESTSVKASLGGTVERSSEITGYGSVVVLSVKLAIDGKEEDVYLLYAHLSKSNVKKGDVVKEGDIIGETGSTGNASDLLEKEKHLHFEIMKSTDFLKEEAGNKDRIDPLNHLQTTEKNPKQDSQG